MLDYCTKERFPRVKKSESKEHERQNTNPKSEKLAPVRVHNQLLYLVERPNSRRHEQTYTTLYRVYRTLSSNSPCHMSLAAMPRQIENES